MGQPFRLPGSSPDHATPDVSQHVRRVHAPHRFRLKRTWPLLTALAAAAVLAFGLFLSLPRASLDWPADRPVLVSFLVDQHNECEVHADRVAAEFSITRAEEAPEAFSRLLGTRAELGDLDRAGLTFLGGRTCAVPGGGQSVHVLLAARHAPDSIASLFIQQDTGTLPIEDGRMYTVLAPADAAGPAASTGPAAAATAHLPEILVWRRDGLLSFLVCNSAIVREASLLALQPPEPGGTLCGRALHRLARAGSQARATCSPEAIIAHAASIARGCIARASVARSPMKKLVVGSATEIGFAISVRSRCGRPKHQDPKADLGGMRG